MPNLAFKVGVFVLGGFAVFILPFLLTVSPVPVYSTAWVGGAENRAAMVGMALLSCIVLLATALRNRKTVTPAIMDLPRERLAGRWLLVTATFVVLWTLVFGLAIVRSGLRVGETNYFLEQTRNVAGVGLDAPMQIYRDLEFPYGPLLLEPPVWLWRLLGHGPVSVGTCYVILLATWNVLGMILVWYTLNRLPMRGWTRRLLFAICFFETLHPLFGPNYSLGKFALPMAALLWGASVRDSYRRALAMAAGLFASLMVSPELGIGLAAAIVVYSVARALQGQEARARQLLTIAAVPAAYGLFLLLYGAAFLDRLRHASGGALNLVIQPMPDMLVFCLAVIWMAPVAVGLGLKHTDATLVDRAVTTARVAHDDGPTLLALFVLALGMLPGALGRSDPLHVFFNGLPFLALSLIAIDRLPRRARLAWAAALMVLAVQVQAANYEMYARSLWTVLSAQRHPIPVTLDVAHLARETGGLPVAAPVLYGITIPDELALRQAHMLVVDPAPGLAEIWDETTERGHIERLRQSRWALLPTEDYVLTEHLSRPEHPVSGSLPKRLLQHAGHALLGFNYPERHQAFRGWRPGAAGNGLELDSGRSSRLASSVSACSLGGRAARRTASGACRLGWLCSLGSSCPYLPWSLHMKQCRTTTQMRLTSTRSLCLAAHPTLTANPRPNNGSG